MEELPAYRQDWVTGEETARDSVRRKFERDKDELRALGIPLETISYRVGPFKEEMEGYRIRREDFYLPYLKLLEEEKDGPWERGSGARQIREPHSSAGDAQEPSQEPAPVAADHLKLPQEPATGDVEPLDLDQDPAAGSQDTPGLSGQPAPGSRNTIELPREAAAEAVQGLRNLAQLPAFPLADAARSALRKITFDLDPEAFDEAPVLFAVPESAARAQEHLTRLSDALIRRKEVTFTYSGIQRGEDTERKVRPYGLLFQHSHWYLVGWDLSREAERLFRVDRVAELEVNPARPNTPDYPVPEGPILERYRDRQAWELGEADDAMEVRVRFRFPLSLWAERNRFGEKVEEDEEGADQEGASVREFQVRQPHAFLRWILSLAGEAEIESPENLRKDLERMMGEIAALYRHEGSGAWEATDG